MSIKVKNCKTFYEAQTVNCLKEIQPRPNPPQPYKILLRLWNKNFLTELYRYIQRFAFKVFQKCSSWTPRNGKVQMFFLTPNLNMFARIFVNADRFLSVWREHIIFDAQLVEARKMNEVFWATLYCKTSDLFSNFCWLWDFLLENLK